jgi:hypothetical protein
MALATESPLAEHDRQGMAFLFVTDTRRIAATNVVQHSAD